MERATGGTAITTAVSIHASGLLGRTSSVMLLLPILRQLVTAWQQFEASNGHAGKSGSADVK